MALIGDLVLQTANAPGTSTFSLIAPVSGRVSFVSGNGAGQVYYIATDGTNWEKGYGTVTAGSPDTLSRDTVIRNSLGTTAKINFSSIVTILSDIPAERAIYAIADNGSVALAGRGVTGAGAAFAADHLPRFDQIGELRLGTYSVGGGAIVVPLPNATDQYRIELRQVVMTATTPLYMRVSVDGGATYLSGASEYTYLNVSAGTAVAQTNGAISYAPLSQNSSLSFPEWGHIDIDPTARLWGGDFRGSTGSTLTRDFPCGTWTTATAITHVLFSGVGSSILAGSARLLRRVFI